MDRISRVVRRFLLSIIGNPISNYHLITIMILMLSKSNYFKEICNWELLSFYKYLPLKLLAWPVTLTILLTPAIFQCPQFPDQHSVHVLLLIYLQMSNTMMLGVNIRLHCTIFPHYCYEDYTPESEEQAEVTEFLFFVLQILILINLAFAMCLLKSIKNVMFETFVAILKYVKDNLFPLMAVANFIFVVVATGYQKVVVSIIVLHMLWKQAFDYFLMAPILDFMAYDFSTFLEDYEIEDTGLLSSPRRQNLIHYGRGLNFLEGIQPVEEIAEEE